MARTLAPAVRRYFSATSRSRGDKYYWSGRFSASAVSATVYEGVVEGTQRYAVSLSLHSAELRVRCACPRFAQQSDPCKHVWTLVLAADAARAFAVPQHVTLARGRERETAERGGRVQAKRLTSSARQAVSERMTRYWAERRAASRPVADEVPPLDWPAPAARPRTTAAREWLDELAVDAPEWQYFLDLARPVADDPLPQAIQFGEIVYVVDVAATAQVGSLQIELLMRTRKQSGDWAKPKAVSISRAQVERLPQAADR
ncbi:MAG: SWIM zinc finger family protein, partial [Vicinamibacterales bacterium]